MHNPGNITLKSGAFAGLKLKQVYALSTPEALKRGYTHGDGRAYVFWLASPDNPNTFLRRAASHYFVELGTDAWLYSAERAQSRGDSGGLGMAAKVESTCPTCRCHIAVGLRIVKSPKLRKWVCGACYQAETGVSPFASAGEKVATS